jgi:general nucleoside transport system permease protein
LTSPGLSIPLGLIVGVVIAALLWVMLRQTRFGFEMRVIGESPSAGRYAGMRTKHIFVAVMILSGALAGLGGASQIGDFSHVLDPRGLQQSAYGYTGIVVAALARYNPLAVVLGSILLGGLTNAGFSLQGAAFPQGLVGTMEGIILFCVLGGELLARYRVGLRPSRVTAGGAGPAEVAAEAPAGVATEDSKRAADLEIGSKRGT